MSGNKEHGIKRAEQTDVMIEPGGIGRGASFSGGESNHYWKNLEGEDFVELSGISGANHSGDSRGFALFDYDRDGYQDFVMVNANEPFVQLYRNAQGDMLARDSRSMPLRLRFRGGNRSAQPSEWSNRDGYGAKVRVTAGDLELLREHRCGEGLGTQNSATMLVGIGDEPRAERIVVEWPGGRTTEVEDVPQGALVTFYENPEHSPNGRGWEIGEVTPAKPPARMSMAGAGEHEALGASPVLARLAEGRTEAPYRMYMMWFTTCSACKRAAPTVDALRRSFSEEELAMFGFNNDPGDSVAEMEAYREKYAPAYDMLLQRTEDDIDAVKGLIDRVLDPLEQGGRMTEASNVTPTTLLTDPRGNVLWAGYGVPTVSDMKQLLHDELEASSQ